MSEALTAAQQDALLGSGRVSARAETWDQTTGTKQADLLVMDGSWVQDASQTTRQTATLTLVGLKSIVPDPGGLAAPHNYTYGQPGINYGSPGVSYGDAQIEALKGAVGNGMGIRVYWQFDPPGLPAFEVLMGYGIIYQPQFINQGKNGATVQLTAYDVSHTIALSGYPDPEAFRAGTKYSTIIAALARRRAPGIDVIFTDPSRDLAAPTLNFGKDSGSGDPWSDICDCATAMGCVAYVNRRGQIIIRAIVNPDRSSPIWKFTTEHTIVTGQNMITDDDFYNGVIVDASLPDGSTVRGVAWDDDPASPYNRTKRGERPNVMSTNKVVNQDQANAMAAAQLSLVLGSQDQVDLTVYHVPHLDADDVVGCVDAPIGVADSFLMQRIEVPLAPSGGFTKSTLSRRTA